MHSTKEYIYKYLSDRGYGTEITGSSHFQDDLGLDSLDVVEFVMDTEVTFNITIPDDDVIVGEMISSVDNAIKYINEKRGIRTKVEALSEFRKLTESKINSHTMSTATYTATSGVSGSSRATGTKINYTFSNGINVTVTNIEQLEQIAKSLKLKISYDTLGFCPAGYYLSATKGMTKLSDMSDYHIRRAIVKHSKEYLETIYDSADTNTKFLKNFLGLSENEVIKSLFAELANRA